MGCASSSVSKEDSPPPVNLQETKTSVSKQDILQSGVERMSQASVDKAHELFHQYRRASTHFLEPPPASSLTSTSTEVSPRRSSVSTRAQMGKQDLLKLIPDVDEKLFDFVWGLFDSQKRGAVCADDFVAAVALLATSGSKSATLDEQAQACFALFDTRNDGYLTYDEFRSMLEATVTISLHRMLHTDAGLQHVEKHMEKEFSTENLTFWQAACAYRSADDGSRHASATAIVDRYIRPNSQEEVNLPGPVREQVLRDFAAASPANPPSRELLSSAEVEIFKLMERDAFARFKSDPDAVQAVVDDFFAQADLSQDGTISYAEYYRLVVQQPHIIAFFTHLAESISALLGKATGQIESKDGNGGAVHLGAVALAPSTAPSGA